MNKIMPIFPKLVLVCTRSRTDGKESCAQNGAEELLVELKKQAADKKLKLKVTKSGCVGQCVNGPTVVIMPDNLWFSAVSQADIPAILALTQVEPA